MWAVTTLKRKKDIQEKRGQTNIARTNEPIRQEFVNGRQCDACDRAGCRLGPYHVEERAEELVHIDGAQV